MFECGKHKTVAAIAVLALAKLFDLRLLFFFVAAMNEACDAINGKARSNTDDEFVANNLSTVGIGAPLEIRMGSISSDVER